VRQTSVNVRTARPYCSCLTDHKKSLTGFRRGV